MRLEFVCIIAFAVLVQTVFALVSCNVKDYGAVGDGVTYEDDAFANALMVCSNIYSCKPGEIGRIVVPRGTYLLSPFNLSSNVELHLEAGSVLLASTNFSLWPTIAEFPSYPDDVSSFCAEI
jgi:polygalacturonase